MRAQRKLAILELLDEAEEPLTDRQIGEQLGLGVASVRRERRELVAEGEAEPVPAPPGSAYPTAGWRRVGRQVEAAEPIPAPQAKHSAAAQLRDQVRALVSAHGPVTAPRLARLAGRGLGSVNYALRVLEQRGAVVRRLDTWRLA